MLLSDAFPDEEAVKRFSSQYPQYWRNMSPYHYLLVARIDGMNARELWLLPKAEDKELAGAVAILTGTLADVEDELLRYFHIAPMKLHSLLGDATADISTSVDVSSRLNAGDAMNELIQRSSERRSKVAERNQESFRSRILWQPKISTPSPASPLAAAPSLIQSGSAAAATSTAEAQATKPHPQGHPKLQKLTKSSLKAVNESSRRFPKMDETQMFLLHTVQTALKNFFSLHGIYREEYKEDALQELSSAALAAMNMTKESNAASAAATSTGPAKQAAVTDKSLSGPIHLKDEDQVQWLLQALFTSQEQCRRFQIRLDLLEFVHKHESKIFGSVADSSSSASLSHGQPDTSMEGFDPESISSASYDDILNEMNDLKMILVEKGRQGVAAKACASSTTSTPPSASVGGASSGTIASSIDEVKRLVGNLVAMKTSAASSNSAHRQESDGIDDQFRGLVSFREQVKEERNEHMKTAVELQIVKEKVVRLQKEIVTLKASASSSTMMLSPSSRPAPNTPGSSSSFARELSATSPVASSATAAAIPVDTIQSDLRNRLQESQSLLEEVSMERERLIRENRRMGNAVKNAEDRVRAVLQDQMLLNSQLQTAEDELEGSRTVMQQLMDRLEQERNLRESDEEKNELIRELRREIQRREEEINGLKEEANQTKRYRQEIATLESLNDELENRLSEQAREVEKGLAAIEQMDRYRIQLSEVTKQNRELSLNAASLENELKGMSQLQARYKDLSNELNDYKLKVEKIPSLMAEIARLRGSSRASMKALMEQDKQIDEMRKNIQSFERENVRLKAENRSMIDMEGRLRDANAEIQRLTAVAGEVSALKTDAKNAEEERKNMEVNYRKMRKFLAQPGGIRSSIISGTGSGGAGNVLPIDLSSASGSSGGATSIRHVKMTAEDFGDMAAELSLQQASHAHIHSIPDSMIDDEDEDDDVEDEELFAGSNLDDAANANSNPFISELRSKLKRPTDPQDG
jgi:hypothetical protein